MSFAPLFRAATASVLLIAGGSLALAQTAPAPAPAAPVAPAPAAPAAPAKPVSASHLDVAIEVVKLSGMSRSIDLIVPQMVDSARRLLTQMRPELSGELEKTIKTLEPDFAAMNATAQRIAGEAFAQRLSEADLTQIKAFFGSEVGVKFVGVQPTLFSEMMRGLDTYSGRLSQIVLEKIREDLKKRGISL